MVFTSVIPGDQDYVSDYAKLKFNNLIEKPRGNSTSQDDI